MDAYHQPKPEPAKAADAIEPSSVNPELQARVDKENAEIQAVQTQATISYLQQRVVELLRENLELQENKG